MVYEVPKRKKIEIDKKHSSMIWNFQNKSRRKEMFHQLKKTSE